MTRYTLIAALVVMAGCATTGELLETGDKSEHTLNRPPALVTACMARNLEKERSEAVPQVLPLDDGGSELVVRTMLVARARPATTGSQVTIWLRPQWFYRKAELIPALLAGC